jgi:predicted RNA-binding Zn-ribbon protein involved in translation (DUF1610 family)
MKKLAEIINFPGTKTAKTRRTKITDVLVEQLVTDNHIKVGHVDFTCPNCQKVAKFDFTDLIFKTIKFFCGNCGHGYQMTNPVFDQSKKNTKTN